MELAFDRDAKGILNLLTDPKAVAARMKDVKALMKREVQGNWAKNRRFSVIGCVACSACARTRRAGGQKLTHSWLAFGLRAGGFS